MRNLVSFMHLLKLALDEVITAFKGGVHFWLYIPCKRSRFGMKGYKVWDNTGYTYNISVYTGSQSHAPHEMETERTVLNLVQKIEGCGYKLLKVVDNLQNY